jgi:hypothetical protein
MPIIKMILREIKKILKIDGILYKYFLSLSKLIMLKLKLVFKKVIRLNALNIAIDINLLF